MTDADLAILARPGQPETLYTWLDGEVKSRIGHRLFTLLYVDGNEVARVYSSLPDAYPLKGRKPMGPTPWGAHVIDGQKPWLGHTMADIRWAFPDYALISSLGCGACINVPVVYDGVVIGTMNALDAELSYTEASVTSIAPLANLLVPAFLLARQAGLMAFQTASGTFGKAV
jgi:hypothetical protein